MRKLVLGLILTVAMAFNAMAYSVDNHTVLGTSGQGDSLFFQFWFADSGIDTKLTVTNTSTTDAVLAKVVIREGVFSEEVRDFTIALSPNDVWTGILRMGANGVQEIYSADDSVVIWATDSSNNPIASTIENFGPSAPFQYSLVAGKCNGPLSYGYVEVIQSSAMPYSAVKTYVESTLNLTGKSHAYMIAHYYIDQIVLGQSGYYSIDALTGIAALTLPGNYAQYQATALSNLDYGKAVYAGAETSLLLGAWNNWLEVEAALSKNNYIFNYDQTAADGRFALGVMTFPTKRQFKADADGVCRKAVKPSPDNSWFENLYGMDSSDMTGRAYLADEVEYTLTAFDLEENSVTTGCKVSPCGSTSKIYFPDEVNFFGTGSSYAEGMTRLAFVSDHVQNGLTKNLNDNITVYAAPSIALGIQFDSNGMSILPLTFDYSRVDYDGIAIGTTTDADINEVYQLVDGLDTLNTN